VKALIILNIRKYLMFLKSDTAQPSNLDNLKNGNHYVPFIHIFQIYIKTAQLLKKWFINFWAIFVRKYAEK